MIHTLEDFIKEFAQIKNQGWITTHRFGSTGIGKTLEDLLGIPENNIDGPDFGDYELKSCRINSHSMLTLFTKAPQPRGASKKLRDKFGYLGDEGTILHATLSADRYVEITDTGHQLKIYCDTSKISIVDEDHEEHAYWTREILKNAFEKKYKGKFVYVKAESRGSAANEQFKFIEAYEMSGFDYDAFIKLLEHGKIYVDLRIGLYHDGPKKGQMHDRGTAFRIRESDHPTLFMRKKIG